MLIRGKRWAQRNAIALLALFVALGGTSYAAMSLPPSSVGTAQLRDGAVTLQKLAPSARHALRGKPGRAGAIGPAGTGGQPCLPSVAGCTGPMGAQGPPGAAGTAKGYALINADGSLAQGLAKGVTFSTAVRGDGNYCIVAAFPVSNVVVTSASPGIISAVGGLGDARMFNAVAGSGIGGDGECGPNYFTGADNPDVVYVQESDHSGQVTMDEPFWVLLN